MKGRNRLCSPCLLFCHMSFCIRSRVLQLKFTSVPKNAEIHHQLDCNTLCVFPKQQRPGGMRLALNDSGGVSVTPERWCHQQTPTVEESPPSRPASH